MSNPAHRALRIILGIFSPAAAGLLFFLRGKPLVMRLFLRLPKLKFPLCCSS